MNGPNWTNPTQDRPGLGAARTSSLIADLFARRPGAAIGAHVRDGLQKRLAPGAARPRRDRHHALEANRFPSEELFWPAHNARFARPAADTGSAFVAFAGTLEDILCAQEDRVVAGDNTVRYKNRTLQIPADRHRHHYVKAQVRVHEYPDGKSGSTWPSSGSSPDPGVWRATAPTAKTIDDAWRLQAA